MTSNSSIEKTYCCYICKARYMDRDKCKQHMMSHMRKETNSNIQSEFNIKPIDNISSQKAIEEVKIENIVDEIKEEVKDEPIENLEDQNDLNLLITDYLHHSNMKYKNRPCGNYFDYKGNLNKHQAMHTGEKPGHQPSIKQELNNTDKEQKYQCSHCEKAFSLKEHLDSHMMLVRMRIYQCDQCDKAFTTKQYLSKHRRIHSREKRYQCSYCDIACSKISILKQHIRTHIGKKPYQCNYCLHPFLLKGNLYNHMGTHTDINGTNYKPRKQLLIGVLPTKRNVLECMMYLLLPLNHGCQISVKEASGGLARKLIRHWGFANIYTKGWEYVSKDIAKLYYDTSNAWNYSAGKKNKKSEQWKAAMSALNTDMERLFDIFCEDERSRKYQEEAAGVKMRKEDYDFLYDMRGERKMYCDNFFGQTWKTYYEQKLKEKIHLCDQQEVIQSRMAEREVKSSYTEEVLMEEMDLANFVDRSSVATFWKKTREVGKSGNFEK